MQATVFGLSPIFFEIRFDGCINGTGAVRHALRYSDCTGEDYICDAFY